MKYKCLVCGWEDSLSQWFCPSCGEASFEAGNLEPESKPKAEEPEAKEPKKGKK